MQLLDNAAEAIHKKYWYALQNALGVKKARPSLKHHLMLMFLYATKKWRSDIR